MISNSKRRLEYRSYSRVEARTNYSETHQKLDDLVSSLHLVLMWDTLTRYEKALAARNQISAYSLVHSAFQTLFSSYSLEALETCSTTFCPMPWLVFPASSPKQLLHHCGVQLEGKAGHQCENSGQSKDLTPKALKTFLHSLWSRAWYVVKSGPKHVDITESTNFRSIIKSAWIQILSIPQTYQSFEWD